MQYPSPAFAVRLDAALRVQPFVSKEEARYYLNGVFVEPREGGGATCVATDGHRMGIRFDPDGMALRPAIVTIPKEIKLPPRMIVSPWLVGVETAPGKGFVAVVDAISPKDEDTAEAAIGRVDDCSIRIGRAFIDGTFPDWRRVVPTVSERTTKRAFNKDYLSSFGRSIALFGDNESSPHLVKSSDDALFLGVLMPMRNDTKAAVPEWISPPKAKAA